MSSLLPPARRTFAIHTKRDRLPWPAGRPFRILAVDGGGIKGIYPAAVLADLERRLAGGLSAGRYFDLLAGTSTGGILMLGLAKGLKAGHLLQRYLDDGRLIFPPSRFGRLWRQLRRVAMYRYSREALRQLVVDTLGDTTLGDASMRLCIPAFGASYSEVAVLKTPHHPSSSALDFDKPMADVALMTAAAPTFFLPYEHGGYRYVDGGVWANNPVMIAVVEALTAFAIEPTQLRVLSLGCGREPFVLSPQMARVGGMVAWRGVIHAAMHLQSENATNQARLLAGPPNVVRLESEVVPAIELDDWRRARDELPALAIRDVDAEWDRIRELFLTGPAERPAFYHRSSV